MDYHDIEKDLPNITKRKLNDKNLTVEERNKYFDEKLGSDYQRLEDIKSYRQRVKTLHKICGNIFYPSYDNVINCDSKCKYCFGTHKLSDEEIKNNIYKKSNGEFSVIDTSNYITNKKGYITVVHNLEGCKGNHSPFNIRYNDLSNRLSCPYCTNSPGVNHIINFLKSNNIKYIQEYVIDYKNKKYRFDFYIEDYDLFVEYDGEQHFREVEFMRNTLSEIQESDNNKNEYCETNKKNLLRIAYTRQKDINEIMRNIVNNNLYNDNGIYGNKKYKYIFFFG